MDGAAGPVDEERLFGLLEIAERQQAAVQAALEGLAAERAALAREREALARGVRDVQLGVQGAARAAVRDGLAEAGTQGVTAIREAAAPLLTRLAGVSEQAGQTEAALRRMVAWASWRLFGRGALVVAALAGLLWLAHLSVWWWTSRDLSLLETQKLIMQSEIEGLRDQVVQMRANRDEWTKAGLMAKLTRCTPGNRPCVRVDESAGPFGVASDYRVLFGY